MPNADAPINLAPSRIANLWPLVVSLVVIVAAFVTLQNDVKGAQSRADAAFTKAEKAEEAWNEVRADMRAIRAIVERIERDRK